ncbi:MAG: hypothetical protein JWO82_2973 [Akkermansiaceae bacterium]|nr:hypothetical protein [Akkermansiaceae bacterium]
MKAFPIIPIVFCLVASPARAFPPAPYYTLFGMVRDQVGQTVRAEGATLILLKGGVEIGRTAIGAEPSNDQNYEMVIRIDQNRSGTDFYSDKAIAAQGLFSLVVEMNGSFFYPIEVAGTLTAGAGGERTRLDLNLGEDRDHDGLPDTWEEWQLYQAGYSPDVNGKWDLSLIDRDGDFDKDGTSNLQEYIAGTFAGDATETFHMDIKEKLESSVRFEFFAITGKTYSIEHSTDAQTWTKVPFSTALPVGDLTSYTAKDVGILPAFTVPAATSQKEFFRLSVR